MSRFKLLFASAFLLCTFAAAAPPCLAQNGAVFVSQTVPVTLAPGETQPVSITMKNNGATTWNRADGFKLGTHNPQDNTLWTGGTRIQLPVEAQVRPGQTWTFNFNIKAPNTPGAYNFQWRMVRELVQWFGQLTPNVVIQVRGSATLCAGVPIPAAGTDAGPALQQCINNTPSGGTLAIPPGEYTILSQVRINKPMTLRTAGLGSFPKICQAIPCAVLKAAGNSLIAGGGFLVVENTVNVTLDSLVFDGNRAARINSAAANHCRAGSNRYGFNSRMTNCRFCRFTNNVSSNALCGTGLEFAGHDATITGNVFLGNGQDTLSADGLTVIFADRATITDNYLMDNTGVALMVGGVRDAQILRNVIRQPNQVAFAGLMLHHFQFADPNNRGDFAGTLVSQNDIHCSPSRNCHFGLMVGSHPWDPNLGITGGTVTGNTVASARQGINVEGAGSAASPLVLYGNTVSGSPASATFTCGTRSTSNLNIFHSVVDRRGDTTPATAWEWHNCP